MRQGSVAGVNGPIARVVMGTMIINTRELEKSFGLRDVALELGCNALDTAHVYAGGDSERAIGRWMEARGNREKVVILSKGAHPNQDRPRVTPHDITADLMDSLARLRTDHIDIYVLHRDDPAVPVGPVVEILNAHQAAGRIRAFGGSNWRHERIQMANEYAAAHGLIPFAASSPNFGLAEQVQDPWGPGCVSLAGPKEAEARAWYQRTQMPVFAYSSLGRGFFSGRVTREALKNDPNIVDGACRTAYCHEVNFQRLDRAEILAKEKGLTVPQIAMAFIANQPLNVFALVGAASGEELRAAIAACEVRLSPEELAWLDLRADRP
jgi:aryl-alcohol dehydrogenase-like predicted oxidoreductase